MRVIKKISAMREKVDPIFSGTTDIIIVQNEDGHLTSSYFNVFVGRLKHIEPDKLLIPQEDIQYDEEVKHDLEPQEFSFLHLQINDIDVQDPMVINMNTGVGYFLIERKQQEKDQQFQEMQDLQQKVQNTQKYILSRKPSQEFLRSLKLNHGKNKLTYIANCKKHGNQQISCDIYFINHKTRIFISDIDGTVTKSDVTGMVFQMLDKDYLHNDICEFYSKLTQRDIIICYLSARSQQQYFKTKSYLQNRYQGQFKLPDGPIILSDDSIFEAFKVEVIYKNTNQLKTDLLQSFKKNVCGGIGNRLNDITAYKSIEINEKCIYLIDKKGVIKPFADDKQLTYKQLADDIDQYF